MPKKAKQPKKPSKPSAVRNLTVRGKEAGAVKGGAGIPCFRKLPTPGGAVGPCYRTKPSLG